jgi:hypothetical protein
LPEGNVVDIFDEVDEDLRAERMGRFARRYAIGFIIFAILLIAGVAGWQAWLWHRHRQDASAATAFIAVLDKAAQHGSAADRQALAGEFAAVAQTAPGGYAALARLNQASLLADAGKLPQAETIWVGLMNDGSVSEVLRQVATLGWAAHEIDTAEPSLIQARLEPLSAEDSPWRPTPRPAHRPSGRGCENPAGGRRRCFDAGGHAADGEWPRPGARRAKIHPVMAAAATRPSNSTALPLPALP